MTSLPPIHVNLPDILPSKHLKHTQLFDSNIFPTCHTKREEWNMGRNPLNRKRHVVFIHHYGTCRYEVKDLYEEAGQLKFEPLA
jgi:hypothetical protein